MITGIALVLTPFVLNALTAITNKLTGVQSTTVKRLLLAFISLVGIVGASAATGNPIDPDSITSIIETIAETFLAFIAAHGSYTMFFKTKPQQQASLSPIAVRTP